MSLSSPCILFADVSEQTLPTHSLSETPQVDRAGRDEAKITLTAILGLHLLLDSYASVPRLKGNPLTIEGIAILHS